MNPLMDCSVVIPTRGGVDQARTCIGSLLESAGFPQLEILVVDDGTASAGELQDEFGMVRVLEHQRPRGFGSAANTGLWHARHERIVLVNDDTRFAPRALGELLRGLDEADAGLVGPVSNEVKPPQQLSQTDDLLGGREEIQAIEASLADLPRFREVEDLSGLCVALRRATLDRIGGFDEGFFPGLFEDDDLSLRVRLRGLRLIVAQHAFLWHDGHATFDRLGMAQTEVSRQMQDRFLAKWGADPVGRALVAHRLRHDGVVEPAVEEARRRWPRWPGPGLD